MTLNFNTEPYYDDFSENNKFQRILFRPSYAIQARELTQLQTILQKQIERIGNHVFRDGSMVIPGQISYDNSLSYVKLTNAYNSITTDAIISNLVGKVVIGQTTGVMAKILTYTKISGSDPSMIYVKYMNSGTNGETKTFAPNEILTTDDESIVDRVSVKVASVDVKPTGLAAGASIQRGVYYVKGFFVLAEEQTIVLSKFTNKPSSKIGLDVVETIVTPENDQTLLDNAQETYNYAAPGAHRYMIDLVLTSKPISDTGHGDFIELLRLNAGIIEYIVDKTDYSQIEETLARRTYDESGNYTVRPFDIDVREYRNNDRGSYAHNRVYLAGDVVSFVSNNKTKYYTAQNSGTSSSSSAITPITDDGVKWSETLTPTYNRGVYKPGDADGISINNEMERKLAIGIEPGKAYIFGHEIEKVSTTYVSVDKSRDTAQEKNVLIPLDLGQYIIVTNINAIPDINHFPTVSLYNRYTTSNGMIAAGSTKIGTAKIRAIEKHNVASGSAAQYKVFLFDIDMAPIPNTNKKYDFINSVKQLYAQSTGNISALNFTADIVPTLAQGSGSVSNSSTSVVGVLTKFTSEFSVGDYVKIAEVRARIISITNDTLMTIDNNLGGNKNGQAIFKEVNDINGEGTSLVFQIPHYAIKSLSDIEYYVSKKFKKTASAPGSNGKSTLTIDVDVSTDQFANPDGNYIIVNRENGAAVSYSSAVRSSNNKSIEFMLDGNYQNSDFDIIATVFRTGVYGVKDKQPTVDTKEFTTDVESSAKQLYLDKADGYALVSVKMKSGTFAQPSESYDIDVTDNYVFATGQTDAYYGTSYLTLKDGKTKPTAPIKVTFQYFKHSSGDFFCVNSYSAIDYKKIPIFVQSSLRDCIDFRPIVDSSRATFTQNTTCLPKFGEDFTCSYSYYLGRKTKIFMSGKGQLYTKNSAPSLSPLEPSDSNDGMLLYKLNLEPYTFSANESSVIVTSVDNKRYTMRDIGSLEKRINSLEYYTSLSLLETETKSLTISDEDGLERFKNGFIVDNFSGHTVGDIVSPDYLNSMDFSAGTLRPFYTMNQVDFVEIYSANSDREKSGYTLSGDLITLPYTKQIYVNQPQASIAVNVNPFAIFTFIGNISITPPYDNWFEVNRRPDLVVSTVDGNYNTIKSIAEKSGVLGTIWNAWQTQWTGARVLQSTVTQTAIRQQNIGLNFDQLFGVATRRDTSARDFNYGVRRVDVSFFATQIGEARTGIQTTLKETFERKTLEDKILSTAVIPYIRSRKILIQARGLMPGTQFYPYFDEKLVLDFCKPAEKITITPVSSYPVDFDSQTNVGNDYKEAARLTAGDSPDMSLNVGDVVYGWRLVNGTYVNTGASAIVVGEEVTASGLRSIYVVNAKDTNTSNGDGFAVGDELRGSISGARGIISSYTKQSVGSPLMTNINGAVNFIFDIPNTDSVRFRTGTRELTLLNISNYDRMSAKSSATGIYAASGQLQERQNQIQLIRNAELVETNLTDTRIITTSSQDITGDTGWYDPLAQTFLVQEATGVFITDVSIYFLSKSSTIPVTCYIVQTINGYPSQKIIPFSRVTLSPEKVNISNNASAATVFKFTSPVYLAPNTEYALVLLSDSNDYKVWVAKMGDINIGTDDTISKQPYAGVFFKSQNASTWTAEQEQDLKFVINRAKFITNSIATIDFENSILVDRELENNPLQLTSGSKVIRVNHVNHGMATGSVVSLRKHDTIGTGRIYASKTSDTVYGIGTVFNTDLAIGSNIYREDGALIGTVESIASDTVLTLTANPTMTYGTSSVPETYRFANSIYGIPASDIYKMHVISNVELDAYTITVNTAAISTVHAGGVRIFASVDVPYDMIQPNMNVQQFAETPINVKFQGVTGKSIDGNQLPYKTFSQLGMAYNDVMSVTVGENNKMPVPMTIASNVNALNKSLNLLSDKKSSLRNSAVMTVEMYSTNEYLTPIIDVRNININAISNKINHPTVNTNATPPIYGTNVPVIDDVIVVSGSTNVKFETRSNIIFASKNDQTVTITTQSPHGFTVGDYVKIDIITPNNVDANFDTTASILSVPSDDTFTYTLEGSDVTLTEITTGTVSSTTGSQYVMIDDIALYDSVATVYSGQFVTIAGSSVAQNNGTFLVTDVDPNGKFIKLDGTFTAGTGTIRITVKDRYFSEITPYGSSAYSKYVTRRIQFANPSTFLKIKFSANIPPKADLEVYYKLNPIGQNLDFDYVEYIKAPTTSTTFVKSLDGSFRDIEIDVPNLTSFDAVTVKIVFLSTESTQIPIVRELRIIACA